MANAASKLGSVVSFLAILAPSTAIVNIEMGEGGASDIKLTAIFRCNVVSVDVVNFLFDRDVVVRVVGTDLGRRSKKNCMSAQVGRYLFTQGT